MKFKNEITLECIKDDRTYRITMPTDAGLGEAYMVAGQFMDEIVRLINDHAEQVKKASEAAQSDSKEEKADKPKGD